MKAYAITRGSLMLLLAALLFIPLNSPTPAAAQVALTVRFGVDSFILGSPVYIADELRIFQKVGIRPVIQPFSFGIDTIDGVLAGRTDVGFALDFPLLLRLQTGQLRVIAAVIEPEPGFHKLAVRRGIGGAADMRGKRLGIAQGTLQHFVTIRYLQVGGVNPAEVQLVPLPSLFEIVAALRRGSIDAAWVWGPGTDEAQQIEGVRILTDDSAAQHRSYGYMVVGAQYLAGKREAVVATLKALVEATDWLNKNLPAAARIISKRNNAPEDRVLTELRKQNSTVSLQRKHINALSELLGFMLENNMLRTRISVPDFFVTRPLQEAAPDRVQIR
ncbi:MAG: ABC transporter substrate-binding protein [Armatimonadota bacterium]|nr:ABC transporter substrate-binding protein [Armatimonadota bacterium]MDR7469608.1 ABC transporter substrate-binding protein [Armatimonadota bacterium]MDR7475784.1 ABC transporter substrate-binding protein [Armatimonadota bacterium]MDR7538328.1 ABC transporter substrate-binding protein [Armatimonadota bacterium]